MKKILRLLFCLSFSILLIQQSSASHGGCRTSVKISSSAKKLDGYKPSTFHVITDGKIEYNHKGNSLPTKTEDYHKEENIPAGSGTQAKKTAANKAANHANQELEKQCTEKKCHEPN